MIVSNIIWLLSGLMLGIALQIKGHVFLCGYKQGAEDTRNIFNHIITKEMKEQEQ